MKKSYYFYAGIFISGFSLINFYANSGAQTSACVASHESGSIISPTEPQKVISIKIMPLKSSSVVGSNVQGLERYHVREIIIKEPGMDPCAEALEEFLLKPYFKVVSDSPGDLKVVLKKDGTVIGINSTATQGYVNGQSVEFNKEVQDWFSKFVVPMAP